MKSKVFTIAILVLFSLCAVQISLFALNNSGFGENPYMVGLVSGVSRWANDSDPPLSSGASTDAHSVLNPDTGFPASFNWAAFAWVHYGGDNPNYKGSYDVKVNVLDFERRAKGSYKGVLSVSRSLTVRIAPPPDGMANNINDCRAYGKGSGKDPTTNAKANTESHIPFP